MKRYVSYRDGGDLRAGCLVDGTLVDLQRAVSAGGAGEAVPFDLSGLLAHFQGLNRIGAIVDLVRDQPDVRVPVDGVEYGPPLPSPGKILCVGMNYPGGAAAPRPEFPTLFLKSVDTLAAHGGSVILPTAARKVFCEGELVLVVGRVGRRIPEERAWEHIAGVTIANDIGAADLEARTSQWQTGKLPDTFLPLGPWVVPVDPAHPPSALSVRVFVNDRLILEGNTAEMFFSPAELFHYISGITTLRPGDLIVTGSPKRLAGEPAGKAWIKAGDELRIDIEGLGSLINPVRKEEVTYG